MAKEEGRGLLLIGIVVVALSFLILIIPTGNNAITGHAVNIQNDFHQALTFVDVAKLGSLFVSLAMVSSGLVLMYLEKP